MKAIKKIYQHNIDLFLPLVAVLLGILIMGLQKPISVQASMAVPMPQSFLGEYSYDGINWNPLEEHADISAVKGDLYLRGHFERAIPQDSRLYFYCDLPVTIKIQSKDIKMFKKEIDFNATNSLAHTKWNCKYHIVFAPKYRRKVFYEEKRLEIREILRT